MAGKILVGCPTCDLYEYVLEDYAVSTQRLDAPAFDVLLVDNSRDDAFVKKIKLKGLGAVHVPWVESAKARITKSRNILRQYVLDNGYEWFLSLEMDMLPPYDVIPQLLARKEKIIAGLYYTSQEDYDGKVKMLPVGECFETLKRFDKLRRPTQAELEAKIPFPVAYAGLGCLLIHRSVLERFKFRYFLTPDGGGGFDDCWFGFDAWKRGFEVKLDPRIQCEHLLAKRPWKWSELKK